jgi:hypothetical protein
LFEVYKPRERLKAGDQYQTRAIASYLYKLYLTKGRVCKLKELLAIETVMKHHQWLIWG